MDESKMTDEAPSEETMIPVWCVIANIAHERHSGPGGQEVSIGTKHFPPGAKVFVVEFYWGMGGERVTVIGRHRGSQRFVTMDIGSTQLANWRVKLVYTPHIVTYVRQHWYRSKFTPDSEEAKANAGQIATSFMNGGAPVQSTLTRMPIDQPNTDYSQ